MLAKRIIPCLDVKEGQVVKGVRFEGHRVVGDILELAKRYRDEGADELVFYDITASPEGRSVSRDWVYKVAQSLDIPFCVAGGIRSVEDARGILNSGADKISVNSPALERPELIRELAEAFGSQCVVVGIDSKEIDGEFVVYQYTGQPDKMLRAERHTMDWARHVEELGAGEIVLNCMSSDGTRAGYDIAQLSQLRQLVSIPIVASGGAGTSDHFVEVFKATGVDAALAASVFHKDLIKIPDLKRTLKEQGVEARL